MIIDLKRPIDLRRLLMSGAIFISDDLVLGACEDYLLYFVGCLRAGEGEGKEKMRSHDDF